jgi:hypothetical protein
MELGKEGVPAENGHALLHLSRTRLTLLALALRLSPQCVQYKHVE